MKKRNRKVACVTGAAGFIGSKLCENLVNRDYKVIAIDNMSIGNIDNLREIKKIIELIDVDIRDVGKLKNIINKSDIIFHLAAIDDRNYCIKDFELAFDVNIKGTANLLSLCSSSQRFVYMSSNMVYGEADYLPISESHQLSGYDPYAITKISSENICKAYSYINDLPYTIIRNFNTFGPRQNITSLVPTLILEGLTKKEVEVWTADTVRDFQYVDNCINNIVKISNAESLICETVNLGSGFGMSVGEITDIICKYIGAKRIDIKKPKPISHKSIADISKLKSVLNLSNEVDMEKAIHLTIEYYKKYTIQ